MNIVSGLPVDRASLRAARWVTAPSKRRRLEVNELSGMSETETSCCANAGCHNTHSQRLSTKILDDEGCFNLVGLDTIRPDLENNTLHP